MYGKQRKMAPRVMDQSSAHPLLARLTSASFLMEKRTQELMKLLISIFPEELPTKRPLPILIKTTSTMQICDIRKRHSVARISGFNICRYHSLSISKSLLFHRRTCAGILALYVVFGINLRTLFIRKTPKFLLGKGIWETRIPALTKKSSDNGLVAAKHRR